MGKNKGTLKVKATPRKSVKPNMGKGTGGFLTTRIIAVVTKNKSKSKSKK